MGPHIRRTPVDPRRNSATRFVIVAAAVVGATPATAQMNVRLDQEPAVPEKAGKVLRAFRIGPGELVIDGRLDESAWARSDSIDDLLQREPDNMQPMSERTVVRVVYDDRHVYVGVRAYDREPGRIAAGLVRRDDPPPSDQMHIGFDPRHDHITGYIYATNPAGMQRDFSVFDDVNLNRDFDAVWEVATSLTVHGWEAEFRIPFAQMRFSVPAAGPMVWGFDVRRDIFRRGEMGMWIGTPRGARGLVSRWGHLLFEDGLPAPRRLELLPFTLARRTETATAPAPAHDVDAGLDARVGIGTAATLSATVNPDFGQVEVDPEVLNLTVYETFFPEKRPFFLEDWRTFVPPYTPFQLFHSRRIGERPDTVRAPWYREVERPGQTTIAAAAKVTGKAAGWTYGALAASTAREYATLDSVAVAGATSDTSLVRLRRQVEPRTTYAAARVQRDVLGGSSNIGALGTAVIRDDAGDAYTGGIDYKIRWLRNRWQWDGHWALTRAPPRATASAGAERTGVGGITTIQYAGKHVGASTTVDHLSSDFRVNDLGFLRGRNDRTGIGGSLSLSQPDPFGKLRSVSGALTARRASNGDGLVFDRAAGLTASAVFFNFWSASLGVERGFEVLDDLDTRGGPPIIRPARTLASASIASDSRRTARAHLALGGEWDAADGWRARLQPMLSWQLRPALQASLGVRYEAARTAAQWIANDDVNGDGTIDHVYGTLRSDVLDLALRSTYALHPDLTFQLYLQPFVAVGTYSDVRKLARPRSFDFEPVTLSRHPHINTSSLRGTFVLRWEYLRGSTVYLAWSRSAIDRQAPGTFRPLDGLGNALASQGTNVWLVKASYWWSP